MAAVAVPTTHQLGPNVLARKCIVCGTTKTELNMKPFLLKGDHLTLWANTHFGVKRQKMMNFYAKLRYTLNPYSCVDHFKKIPFPQISKSNQLRRTVEDLISNEIEPPSIENITQRKDDTPPPADPPRRSEEEVTTAVMAILKKAQEEMATSEKTIRKLKRISRRAVSGLIDGSDPNQPRVPMPRVPREKKKRRKRILAAVKLREAAAAAAAAASTIGLNGDGNEADESESSEDSEGEEGEIEIDVEGVESEYEEETDTSSSCESELPPEPEPRPPPVIPLSRQPKEQQQAAGGMPTPPPTVMIPRKFRPSRPYMISHPAAAKAAAAAARQSGGEFMIVRDRAAPITNVPKRLTLIPATRKPIRPSWIVPGDQPATTSTTPTLASVLHKFWNEDLSPTAPLNTPPPFPRLVDPDPAKPATPAISAAAAATAAAPFGRSVLPGTKTKFVPASSQPQSLLQLPQGPSKRVFGRIGEGMHSSVRKSMLLVHNPPLSPSRLIIGGEETVVTTTYSDDEQVRLSSESSSTSDEEMEVEVVDSETTLVIPEGEKIEGVVEAMPRSRTISVMSSDEGSRRVEEEKEREEGQDGKEGGDEEMEIDVETVDDRQDEVVAAAAASAAGSRTAAAAAMDGNAADDEAPKLSIQEMTHRRKRKQKLAKPDPATLLYYRTASQARRIIIPPPALTEIKPPTKLLSAGTQFSMKELLQAQVRAASSQPVKIDTSEMAGLMNRTVKRPSDMPKLESEVRNLARFESEFSRLNRMMERKRAAERTEKEREKRRAMAATVDYGLIAENPPPVLDRVEENAENAELVAAQAKAATEKAAKKSIATLLGESQEQRKKVLRMTFHTKDQREGTDDVDVSKLKVLDRSTIPLGIGREEEVAATPDVHEPIQPLSQRERREGRKEAEEEGGKSGKKERTVPNPMLVIIKNEVMALRKQHLEEVTLQLQQEGGLLSLEKEDELEKESPQQAAPPPTPVVGIPDEKAFAARREMYEKKRQHQLHRLQSLGLEGRARRAEWKRMRERERRGERMSEEEAEGEVNLMEATREAVKRAKEEKMRGELIGEMREDPEMDPTPEEVDIVRIVKEDKRKRAMRRTKDDEDFVVMVMSDISGGEEEEDGSDEEEEEVETVVDREKEKEVEEETEESEGSVEVDVEGVEEGEKDAAAVEVAIEKLATASTDAAAPEAVAANAAAPAAAPPEKEKKPRRKSHRLRVKHESMPRERRRLIWKMSDDEDIEEEEGDDSDSGSEMKLKKEVEKIDERKKKREEKEGEEGKEKGEKKKRGRPRKHPIDPAVAAAAAAAAASASTAGESDAAGTADGVEPVRKKSKREEKEVMTEREKGVLDRIFSKEIQAVIEKRVREREKRKKEKEERMEKEGGEDEGEVMAVLEKESPIGEKEERRGGQRKSRKSLDEQLMRVAAASVGAVRGKGAALPPGGQNELGGRVCMNCLKREKRYILVSNNEVSLKDHARTHCVETLMCPNESCTYMNQQRSRVSQHVSYVHKKWGMPIDLTELYPSMKKSLMMRMRQCFPDLPNLAVCQLCRVAVLKDYDHQRWHAQSHLPTSEFRCSRNICKIRFSSEQECLEHIERTKCLGSVVSSLSDEMKAEVLRLRAECFGNAFDESVQPPPLLTIDGEPLAAAAAEPATEVAAPAARKAAVEQAGVSKVAAAPAAPAATAHVAVGEKVDITHESASLAAAAAEVAVAVSEEVVATLEAVVAVAAAAAAASPAVYENVDVADDQNPKDNAANNV